MDRPNFDQFVEIKTDNPRQRELVNKIHRLARTDDRVKREIQELHELTRSTYENLREIAADMKKTINAKVMARLMACASLVTWVSGMS